MLLFRRLRGFYNQFSYKQTQRNEAKNYVSQNKKRTVALCFVFVQYFSNGLELEEERCAGKSYLATLLPQ
jgi:hypothetical protein